MARLPRYQESGLISADIPRLDFANLREQSRVTESVSSALDRISQFAFGRAEAQQKQFAEEQKQRNQIMAIQLRTDLEMQASLELAKLTSEIELGTVQDLTNVQETLSALGREGAKALSVYSPEQASAFVNTVAGQGRAVMARASSVIVQRAQATFNLQADDVIKAQEKNLETVFETTPSVVDALKAVGEARKVVSGVAIQTSNPVDTMRKFEKATINARNNVLVREFTKPEFSISPASALQKMDSNDVGRFSEVWKSMTIEEREEVRDRVLKRNADVYAVTERERKTQEEQNKAIGLSVREDLYRGRIGPNEAIDRLRSLNDISPAEMKAIIKGDDVGASDEMIGRYESLVDRGQMGEIQIDELARRGSISWKQANSLKRIARGSNPADADARRFIEKSLGVPDPLAPGFKDERLRAAQVQAEYIVEKETALSEGKPFNPLATAQRLVTARLEQADVSQQKAAIESLETKLESLGLQYRTNYTDEELKRLGIGRRDRKTILDRSKIVRGEK
jgi:hypothetical protein